MLARSYISLHTKLPYVKACVIFRSSHICSSRGEECICTEEKTNDHQHSRHDYLAYTKWSY